MLHDILASLARLITTIISTLGYPGIILITVIENVFPPIPSEAVLPFAGYLASRGDFCLFWAVFSGTLGSVFGAMILYAFGYYGNEKIVRRFIRRFGKWFMISEEDLDKAEDWFKKYGSPAVFTARIIPIIRSIISIPAGFAKMPMGTFLFYTTFGTALWSSILVYAGYLLGENWELVGKYLEKYELVALVVIAAVCVYVVVKRLRRNQKASGALSSITE
jgi:membrane protein DedA with SNARE-associated domain